MPTQTRWGTVAALLIAGVIVAMQIGKAAVALPALQRELTLTLSVASWVVGAYGMLGAAAGLPAGMMSSLFTARKALLGGMTVAGLGSIAGALADNGALLIGMRVIEGCGFLVATLAIPRLLHAVTAPKDLDTVLPLFGAYLPTGSVLMMLAGPQLMDFGWQALWVVNGVAALAWLAVIACLDFKEPPVVSDPIRTLLPNIQAALGAPGPLLLGLIFGTYTFQYMALTGLLPTLLVERLGLSIAAAGAISAITVAANALGNMSASMLLRAGVPMWAIAAGAFGFVGLAGFGFFSDTMPVVVIAALASANLALTGLIPGSVYATAPKLAPTSAVLAIVLGLINQTTNMGNLLGPAVTAFVVDMFGWECAPFIFAGIGIAGVTWALLLRRVLRRTPLTST
jgi:MFS family permease